MKVVGCGRRPNKDVRNDHGEVGVELQEKWRQDQETLGPTQSQPGTPVQ